jgi:hypothetical protein
VKFELVETTPADASTISAFLSKAFHLVPGAPLVSAPHMHWKYWAPRQDWTGSRSFLVRRGPAVAAHAAVWPVRIKTDTGVVPTIHLIDWAADAAYPGVGIWLLRQMGGRARALLATGGSDATRRILPLVGFRRHSELHCFARPLRPLGQALTTSAKSWRRPARLVRNLVWRWFPPMRLPVGWSASPLDPDDVAERLWPAPSGTTAVIARDAELYRYLRAATPVRHVLFGIRKSDELVGYFCLAFAGHVARIADLWMPSDTVDDWRCAFMTAAVTASCERAMYEVTAWAATPLAKEALQHAGFRCRDCTHVSMSGDARLLDGRMLHVQMLDCDASFICQDDGSYLTC